MQLILTEDAWRRIRQAAAATDGTPSQVVSNLAVSNLPPVVEVAA